MFSNIFLIWLFSRYQVGITSFRGDLDDHLTTKDFVILREGGGGRFYLIMGPLQVSDHVVQKPPYWNANCALGYLKQSKII